jgi:Domain of unknown function (DUF4190)
MKRCPTCNRTFEEDWLSFCTADGTQLVDSLSPSEPPPTIRVSAVDTNPAGRPTFDLPGSYTPPPVQYAQPPMVPAWQPPPAPMAYTTSPQQGLALTSMILGLVSITIGWCCYFGVITSPISIIMGAVALSQIKKDPQTYGGKPLAIIGVSVSSFYLVMVVLFILLWGFSFLLQGMK